MNNPESLISFKNITKTYTMGDYVLNALDEVSFKIEQGEYASLFGPSGSGKSTIMNILGCLDHASSGEYKLDGKNVKGLTKNQLAHIRNQKIGFVFQKFNLLEYATALENVCLPLIYRGISAKARESKAMALLEAVDLASRQNHKPNELSGGQQQRVAIARALVTDPDIILADEPTGNLDSKSGQEVTALFENLVDQGKTVIIVTHSQEMANRTQRILSLRDGRLQS